MSANPTTDQRSGLGAPAQDIAQGCKNNESDKTSDDRNVSLASSSDAFRGKDLTGVHGEDNARVPFEPQSEEPVPGVHGEDDARVPFEPQSEEPVPGVHGEDNARVPFEPQSEEPVPEQTAGDDVIAAAHTTAGEEAVPPEYSSFTLWEKRAIVLAASVGAFFSPLSAQIYLPALNVISSELHVSATQVNLTVTTYMIFQGLAPMFIGGLSDSAGRRPAFIICFVIYIAANIGLALSKNFASLLIVRCLQSAGSSSTVALASAVVSDIVTSAERGQYIGITVLPIVLAPSLGPVLGGILSHYLGWQAIFWFLAIAGGVILVLMLFFFPETCRKIVGDGSARPHPVYRTLWQVIKDSCRRRKAKRLGDEKVLSRMPTSASQRSRKPLKIERPNVFGAVEVLFEKELGLLLAFSAVVFAGFYAIATSMPSQMGRLYGFDDIIIGLLYLPLAGGSAVTAFVVGPAMNWNYRRHRRRLGLPVDKNARSRQDDLSEFPIERARLEVGIPLLALAAIVMLCWGWALQEGVNVAVPCVLLFLMGVGMIGFNNSVSVLLIDVNPGNAGSAVAANNLTRCLVGAGASAAIVPMSNAMGIGWAFFLFGCLYICFMPVLLLIMRNGIQWRAELREKKSRREKARQEKNQRKQTKKQQQQQQYAEYEPYEGNDGKEDEKRHADPEKTSELARDNSKEPVDHSKEETAV